jgi:hypothetical protein
LDAIDTDKDGRIRVPEVRAAVRWATGALKNADELVKGGDTLALASINDQTDGWQDACWTPPAWCSPTSASPTPRPSAWLISSDPGPHLCQGAFQRRRRGLGRLGQSTRRSTAGHTRHHRHGRRRAGSQRRHRRIAGERRSSSSRNCGRTRTGGPRQPDAARGRSGGADPRAGDAGRLGAPQGRFAPRSTTTFARCRVVAFDARAANPLNRAKAEFVAMSARNLAAYCDEFIGFPLARVEAGRPLCLTDGINPAWSAAIGRFRAAVVVPEFGLDKTVLSESDWAVLLSRFAPCEAWLAAKQGAAVEKLGLPRIREILAGGSRDYLTKTIARDLAVAPAMAEIANVEKLLRYHRDLVKLLNNFVSFSAFYALDGKAIFQAGTLYMDGRACHLCVRISDAAAHAPVADLGRTYLAYCEISRPAPAEKSVIAAAFTGGDSDQLRVGRNGVFYDSAGLDWDARVIKTVEHPISIHQAFWSPYKRLARMFNEQIEKFASAREQAVMDKASTGVETAAKAVTTARPAGKSTIDTGTLAAIGIIMAGLATAASNVFAGFLKLAESRNAWWQIPAVFAALILAVSGPSMVIAWLKLRKRDLGPILDGCGWAINGRIKLNMALGRALTELAVVPRTAIVSIEDLYPDDPPKVPRWLWITGAVVLLIAVLEFTGVFARWGVDSWIQRPFVTVELVKPDIKTRGRAGFQPAQGMGDKAVSELPEAARTPAPNP